MANITVTALAAITGISFRSIPYISQSRMPLVNMLYMTSDIPLVSFVRTIFIICGSNEKVVQAAAARPINCILSKGIY